MKTIGIIGGLTWFSTLAYYRTMNEMVNNILGGAHSAQILLYSVNFQEIKNLQDRNEWEKVADRFIDISKRLELAGADCLVIASNTPHLLAEEISGQIDIPLIHIAEVTALEIRKQNLDKVALIGTKFTMEESFFKDRLVKYGIQPVLPEEKDRDFIHSAIFEEFAKGKFLEPTKKEYLHIIESLKGAGAEGVIFGCTEIRLLISPEDCPLPVFDTILIHCRAAVEFALG